MTPPWESDTPLDRLRRHAHRSGAELAARNDPMAHMQIAMLGHFLTIADVAMADEHIDPDTARRVLDRITYGCAPNPVDAAERRRLMELMTVREATRLSGFTIPTDTPEQT